MTTNSTIPQFVFYATSKGEEQYEIVKAEFFMNTNK
jgi:hypothetical protein